MNSLPPQWVEAMNCLLNDLPLPEKFHDHALKGDKKGIRDCHIKPDLILLYTKLNDDELVLHRLGSHSELTLA